MCCARPSAAAVPPGGAEHASEQAHVQCPADRGVSDGRGHQAEVGLEEKQIGPDQIRHAHGDSNDAADRRSQRNGAPVTGGPSNGRSGARPLDEPVLSC